MENNNDKGHFQRKMQARHVVMLSLGGVIGTGLFLVLQVTPFSRRDHWEPFCPI